MKRPMTSSIVLGLFVASAIFAQSTQTKAWKTYGATVTQETPTSLSAALKKKTAKDKLLIEGTISQVCQNKGCWMVVADGETTVRVEFESYGFFVPWDSEGKRVRMKGKIATKSISAKAAEHMEGEMKNPPVKSREIKGKQDIVVFTASAVEIEGGSEISAKQQEIIEGTKKQEGHKDE